MIFKNSQRHALVLTMAAFTLAACALNPATGRRQLSLVSQSQEISMGRDADKEFVASLGLYENDELQAYLTRLGKEMAATSERPDLPWTFRLVDDPVVNAFALPGGYIYITRGIMAHFASEAELAAVLGHEIGHVTSRHSVNQMSKAQLASLGLGLGLMVDPGLQRYGDLTGMGLGLLFLKYGRDDERQADELGLRYMVKAGHNAGSMVGVFDMLGQVSQSAGSERTPGWLSTHPTPENRRERTEAAIAAGSATGGSVNEAEYLRRLDGMVFGNDPRQGFFRDTEFLHPELKFRLQFPTGWTTANQRSQVAAMSPEKDALLQLTLAAGDSLETAAGKFFSVAGVSKGAAWETRFNGLPGQSWRFTAAAGETPVAGLAAFIQHQGHIFSLVAYGASDRWPGHEPSAMTAISSFARLTDPADLNVQPMRLEMVRLSSSMTLEEFARSHPSAVPVETLAMLNRAAPGDRLERGRTVKRVIGGP